MLVLGIESSCDETGAAIVRDGRYVLSNALASQADLHARYGGVVPEVAARQQLAAIAPALETALQKAGCSWEDIDAVAASYGPGLAGPLLIGLTAAKTIAFASHIPFLGINHLEAHIYANWLIHTPENGQSIGEDEPEPQFPLVCLLVSGAHSELMIVRDHGVYELLGQTRDDAAGEAFDKVARILGLRYPGGPSIQNAAKQADASSAKIRIPRAKLRNRYDFSFSGVKSHVYRMAQAAQDEGYVLDTANVAAAFQESVVESLVTRTVAAAREFQVSSVVLAGGVAANLALRQKLTAELQKFGAKLRYPPIEWCTDNAAMIAGAAYYHLQRGETSPLTLDVAPQLTLPLYSPASSAE